MGYYHVLGGVLSCAGRGIIMCWEGYHHYQVAGELGQRDMLGGVLLLSSGW